MTDRTWGPCIHSDAHGQCREDDCPGYDRRARQEAADTSGLRDRIENALTALWHRRRGPGADTLPPDFSADAAFITRALSQERAVPAIEREAAERAVRQEAADTSAWLIERGQPEQQVPTVWWTGHDWTEDANKATRYASREDAERVIDGSFAPPPSKGAPSARAVEHRWLDTSYHARRVARRHQEAADNSELRAAALSIKADHDANGHREPCALCDVLSPWPSRRRVIKTQEPTPDETDR